ncbi:uncharacterized protein LOC106072979 isoform X2 [Biomphalaria glabrata]|uniref:Uncharacterized protein LOC106072979 isoform X2 n=1 Tax=Biomphalaria glabrata TaxID=6526 RepID=A0A9W3ACL0_BIOGL|nr:uncharacterized protein LOC106072979 isoform X2 [Biomphalaria glabrata]
MWWILLITIASVQSQGSCDSNGNCIGSSCSDGWFGSGCQYSDVVINATILPQSLETLRSNSSRQDCGQRVGPLFVLLTWKVPLPFTWLRIKLLNKTTYRNITLSLNNALCQKTKIFSVDDTTLDIACDANVSMTTLKLEGDVVGSICTLFVSGGRNFALFQQTSQSSSYYSDGFNAKFAVDGRIIPSCLLGGCSHTHRWDSNPTWTVYFDQRVQINKFVLYNRIDDKQERLKGFLLEMLDSSNLTIYSYQNNSEPTRLVYTVLNLKAGAGAAVRISQKNIIGSDSVPFVTLNEFEAFGECLPGFWGLNCRNVCESACSSSCHAEHGKCNTLCIGYTDPPQCSIECKATQWGPNCLNHCSVSCYNSSCDKLTGLCLSGCLGYQDFPYCTTKCNKAYSGVNCTNSCPSNCLNATCDYITGKCSDCTPGYTGDYCNNPCFATCFGSNHKGTCSIQCSQCICDLTVLHSRI